MPVPRKKIKQGEINVIVLAGVALQVLILIIGTAPQMMMHEAAQVTVPQTYTIEKETEDALTVALTADHRLFLNDEPIEEAQLASALIPKLTEDPFYLVLIRADEAAKHEWVLDILSSAKEIGAKRIAFATKRKKEEVGK